MTRAAKIVWFVALAIFLGWLTHRAFSQTFQRSLPFLAKSSSAWAPSIPPLGVWLVATNGVTNINGTVATNGETVGKWVDLIGPYTFTNCPDGGGAQPQFFTNPYPRIYFGARGAYSNMTTFTTEFYQPFTIMIVANLYATNNSGYHLFHGAANNVDDPDPYIRYYSDPPRIEAAAGTLIGNAYYYPFQLRTNFLVTWAAGGGNSYIRINSSEVATGDAGNWAYTNMMVGAFGGTYWWYGDVFEVRVYRGLFDTNSLQTTEADLKTKWGIL